MNMIKVYLLIHLLQVYVTIAMFIVRSSNISQSLVFLFVRLVGLFVRLALVVERSSHVSVSPALLLV